MTDTYDPEFPPGTVLIRTNVFSGQKRRIEVTSCGPKEIRGVWLDGPLKGDNTTLKMKEARACERG